MTFPRPKIKSNMKQKGKEAREIWEWLEQRNRLDELDKALNSIGRHDIAPCFEQHRTKKSRKLLPPHHILACALLPKTSLRCFSGARLK